MITQGTPEWIKARIGLLTASRMADAMAYIKPKTALCVVNADGEIIDKLGNGKTAEKRAVTAQKNGLIVRHMVYEQGAEKEARAGYKRDIIAERLTGFAVDHYVTPAMQWGLDHEQAGKNAYEAATGNPLMPAGFILHPNIDLFGATPDSFVDDGCFELKCPTTDTHLKWLIGGVVPDEYKPQMLGEMLCSKRRWCEFVSYDPRLPDGKKLFIRRYEPTPDEFAEVEAAAVQFLAEVDRLWDELHTAAA